MDGKCERIADDVETIITQNPKAVNQFREQIRSFQRHVDAYHDAIKQEPDVQQPDPLKWGITDKLPCYYATLAVIYDSVKTQTLISLSDGLDSYTVGMLQSYLFSAQSPYDLDSAIRWVKADFASGGNAGDTNPSPKEKEPWYKIAHPIIAIIVGLIVIFGFITGIRSCRDLSDKKPSSSPTTQPDTPPVIKSPIDPNIVDINKPISKPPKG